MTTELYKNMQTHTRKYSGVLEILTSLFLKTGSISKGVVTVLHGSWGMLESMDSVLINQTRANYTLVHSHAETFYKPKYFSFSLQKKEEKVAQNVALWYKLKKLKKKLSRYFIKVDSGPIRPVVTDAENHCVGFTTA